MSCFNRNLTPQILLGSHFTFFFWWAPWCGDTIFVYGLDRCLIAKSFARLKTWRNLGTIWCSVDLTLPKSFLLALFSWWW